MSPALVVAYLLLGRLFTWTLQVASPIRYFTDRTKLTTELFECDFCLGVWVFWFVSSWMEVDFIYELPPVFEPFNYFVTALISSFIVHVFRIGWEIKFHV